MKLIIYTPREQITIEDIKKATLQTSNGEITVLPGHESLITDLAPGSLDISAAKGDKQYAIFEGYAKITSGNIEIYCAGVERSENLNEALIQESIQKAQEMQKSAQTNLEFATTAAALERELAKLKTVRRRKYK